MENLIRIRLSLIVLMLAFFMSFNACSTKDMNTAENDEEIIDLKEDDYTESNEDLFTVDYKEFYDQLSSKGQWIEIDGEELGIDVNKGSATGEIEMQRDLLSYLTGVNNSYAAVADLGMFFVWKPAPELAVSIGTPEPAVYVPYTNGQWMNTDAGWYFKAPTPVEEVTHHYGRWVNSPLNGWVWVPGRVWAPAWVDWRENDNYVAWAPVPPTVYLVNNVIPPVLIPEERYVVVEKRYFVEPFIYQYRTVTNTVVIREMVRPNGVMVVNNTIINRGPDIVRIETVTQKSLGTVKIKKVKNRSDVVYASDQFAVYVPEFKKIKAKGKEKQTVKKPDRFTTSNEVNKGKNPNENSGDKKSTGQPNSVDESDKQKSTGNDKGNNKGNDKGNNKQFKDNSGKSNDGNSYDKKNQTGKNNNKQSPNIKNNNSGNENKSKGNTGKNKGGKNNQGGKGKNK